MILLSNMQFEIRGRLSRILVRFLLAVLFVLITESNQTMAQEGPYVGKWIFSESIPSLTGEGVSPSLRYDMKIVQVGGGYRIKLYIDGEQTLEHMEAVGILRGHVMRVVFEKYEEPSIGETYSKGDVLFTLSVYRSRLTTCWKRLHPQFDESANCGEGFRRLSK